MIEIVGLVRILMGRETALAGHGDLEFSRDPIGKAKSLYGIGLRLPPGRHLPKRDLRPNRSPGCGVGLVDRVQAGEREITFLGFIIVAIEAMALEETFGEGIERFTDRFARSVSDGGLRLPAQQNETGDGEGDE